MLFAADGLNDSAVAVTAFAPTDEAFENFAAQQNMTLDELIDSTIIAPILQYHLVAGPLKVDDLQNGDVLPSLLSGQNLTVSLPPTTTAQSLGIQSFRFVILHGIEGDALIINQDIPAGQVSDDQVMTLS